MRWDRGLSKRPVAVFSLGQSGGGADDIKLSVGRELRLKLDGATAALHGAEWEAQGVIVRLLDGEVVLEIRGGAAPPTHITDG